MTALFPHCDTISPRGGVRVRGKFAAPDFLAAHPYSHTGVAVIVKY